MFTFSLLVSLCGTLDLGITLGRGFYRWWGIVGYTEGHAATLWLGAFWYFAATRGLRLPRPLALVCVLVAMLPLVIAILGYWRLWAGRWHAF